MAKYNITQSRSSLPHCYMQERNENLFESTETRDSLPQLLQDYYEYLTKLSGIGSIKYIMSLEEEQDTRIDIKFFSDHNMSEVQINKFFKQLDDFITYEKANTNQRISIVIEAAPPVLEMYSQYILAKKEALEVKKQDIAQQVQQEEIKPTVLKWTGGAMTILGGVGFAVGGPIGGFFGAGLGLVFGPFVGLNAISASSLSLSAKTNIEKYTSSAFVEERLTAIPLGESALQAVISALQPIIIPEEKGQRSQREDEERNPRANRRKV